MLGMLQRFFSLGAAALVAATFLPPGAAADARERKTPHVVPRASGPIRIDGVLDEEAWRGALSLELPFETDPGENIPSPTRTVCSFTADAAKVYVGCVATDPTPGRIRARYADRDTAFPDDLVGVVLDTFNDERRAFEFFVNPLGVQMDMVQDDVNQSEDSSWDAIWESAGRITATGYEVEMAIPFTSLRFQRGDGEQTWGLDVVRMWPRDRRFRIALNPKDRNVTCYLCQTSKITGFGDAEPGKNLEIDPTFTATRSMNSTTAAGDLDLEDSSYEPGLTARWGFTPNLTWSSAINPDFSQVEADAARLDVNEQFALFYPEKRPFFMEAADLFETPIQAIYTRTLADPDWGTKLTGKEGRNALGAFVVKDGTTNLLFPGSQESSLGSLDAENLSAVLRYRRDLGKSSALGAVVTSRQGDGYSNQVAGIDALIRPTTVDTLRLQWLGSATAYPDAVAAQFGQPTGTLRDDALLASYVHDTRNWAAQGSFQSFGPDFRADLGFVPQVGYGQMEAAGEYRWYGDASRWFNRMTAGAEWHETNDAAGNLIVRELEGSFTLDGPKELVLSPGVGARTQVYNGVAFDQSFVYLYFEMNPGKNSFIFLDSGYGDRIDFSYAPAPGQARQGRQLDLAPGLRYHFGRHVRLNLSYAFRRLTLPEGELFRANLTDLRLAYQANLRTLVRLILQYGDVEYSPLLSIGQTGGRDLFTQLLFSYKLNPQTALYLGGTDERTDSFAGATLDALEPTGRAIFFKVGYAWVP